MCRSGRVSDVTVGVWGRERCFEGEFKWTGFGEHRDSGTPTVVVKTTFVYYWFRVGLCRPTLETRFDSQRLLSSSRL